MPNINDYMQELAKTSLYGCLLNFFQKNPNYPMNPIDFVAVLHLLANEFGKRVQNPSQYKK